MSNWELQRLSLRQIQCVLCTELDEYFYQHCHLDVAQVSMSNWELPRLSLRQIQYAALDALLAGHAFRGLR